MKIIRAKDYADMSRKAANIISAQVIMKPNCVLGLATGGTPVGTYKQLVEWYNKGDLDFAEVNTVNLDEYRGLPREHPESYWSFMHRNLFDLVNIRPEAIHMPAGTNMDAAAECSHYDEIIQHLGGVDLQLLGIGHDGHIGFNEPGAAFELGTHCVHLTKETIEANKRFFDNNEDLVPKEAYTMGIKTIMLTGDAQRTAQAIHEQVGTDEVIAGVLPADKERVVRELSEKGKVAMVGDGINDAPALARADVGIAIGAGTDIALSSADIVLMHSDLMDVPAALDLSRATLRNIKQNLFWALFYNGIGIPLAAGVFISLLGWKLNPMFGAAAMSLSSFCVVSNALRLNLFRLRDGRHDRALHPVTLPNIAAQPGAKVLTMRIDGMMCAHCEARVKAALEAVDGVQSAAASHEAGTAVVTLKADADENALKPLLKAVVEENDYEVKGFDK